MNVLRNAPVFTQLLTKRSPHAGHVLTDDDVEYVRIRADDAIDMQMDGDYVGTRVDVRFGCSPDRLAVVAPTS